MSKKCYFCGRDATSKEHAPPKLMFKGFKCDSITVPSCEKHNSKKSGEDQAIVNTFLQSISSGIENGFYDKSSLEEDVLKAISIAAPYFRFSKRKVTAIPFLKDPFRQFSEFPDLAYFHSDGTIRDWIRQLTAALIFDVAGYYDPSIYWNNIKPFSPNWVHTPPAPLELKEAVANLFLLDFSGQLTNTTYYWLKGWSAKPTQYPPDIYHFKYAFSSNSILFKHVFYNRYTWFIRVPVAETTVAEFQTKTTRANHRQSEYG